MGIENGTILEITDRDPVNQSLLRERKLEAITWAIAHAKDVGAPVDGVGFDLSRLGRGAAWVPGASETLTELPDSTYQRVGI